MDRRIVLQDADLGGKCDYGVPSAIIASWIWHINVGVLAALYAQHTTNLYSTRNIAIFAMMLAGKLGQVMTDTAEDGSYVSP